MVAEILCTHCQKPFTPMKRWARFCSKPCRVAFHNACDGGLRGLVSSVRVMRRGQVSVVIRFALDDRDRALQFEPGHILEVVSQ